MLAMNISRTNQPHTAAPPPSEAQLVAAAQKDISRFEPLYNHYYEPVVRFLARRLDDQEQAFDLASQVFLKAMQNLGKYEQRGLPFGSWLFRIARNELYNHFKQSPESRSVNIETQEIAGNMADEMEENSLEPYMDKMIEAIGSLPEDDLQMIEMRYFEKRPYKEIGEILDMTENNAKVKTYRILEKLKKLILAK